MKGYGKLHWPELLVAGVFLIVAGGIVRSYTTSEIFSGPADALYNLFINHFFGWFGLGLVVLAILKALFSKVNLWPRSKSGS